MFCQSKLYIINTNSASFEKIIQKKSSYNFNSIFTKTKSREIKRVFYVSV